MGVLSYGEVSFNSMIGCKPDPANSIRHHITVFASACSRSSNVGWE
jgi:hypothetical protein